MGGVGGMQGGGVGGGLVECKRESLVKCKGGRSGEKGGRMECKVRRSERKEVERRGGGWGG